MRYFLDKGAERQGIADFVEKSSRDQRRKLVMNFWQD
jgi:hypothetical protein